METILQFIRGIGEFWGKLTLSAKVIIVGSFFIVFLGLMFIVYIESQPQYVTLSSGLSPQEISKITDILTRQGIKYQLGDNNTSISVPISQRSNAQILLAQNDLPVGRPVPPGWELFSATELMTNQWLQNVKFMRAIQGEIQKQLNAFDFVNDSYVLIREAKEELFVSEQKPSEAAITLDINRPLTKQEVKAIVSIVDHAGGPNLHPGNITVVSTKGDVLYLPPQSSFASLASSKLELLTEWEKQRETKVMNKLRELGVHGTVSVSAKINFDSSEEMEEKVSEGTEISTSATETTSETAEKPPEGAPGVVANVPEATVPGVTSSKESTTEEITNYEPSRLTRKKKIDGGNVEKFLVTLIIEGDYQEAQDEQGNKVRNYIGLTEDRKKMYKDLVLSAVGEGEVPTEVLVYDQPFGIAELETATPRTEEITFQWRTLLTPITIGIQLMALFVVFLLLRSFLRKTVMEKEEVEEKEIESIELPTATNEDLKRQEIERKVAQISVHEPETAAALIRSWLSEGEE